jgi:hypothetical protein
MAEAQRAQADAVKTQAETELTQAKTVETLEKTQLAARDQILRIIEGIGTQTNQVQ